MSKAQNIEHQLETPDTIKHITPQPSTPIERAGSDYSDWGWNINKYM